MPEPRPAADPPPARPQLRPVRHAGRPLTGAPARAVRRSPALAGVLLLAAIWAATLAGAAGRSPPELAASALLTVCALALVRLAASHP